MAKKPTKITDTMRLDWILRTLYLDGWFGISHRLHWGLNEPPDRLGIDAAMHFENELTKQKGGSKIP